MASLYLTSAAAKGNTDGHNLMRDFAGMTKSRIKEDREKLEEARKGQVAAREIAQGLAQATVDEHHREGMDVVIDIEKDERKEVQKMRKAYEKKKRYGKSSLSKHELKRYNKWKSLSKAEQRNLAHGGSLASGGTTGDSGGGMKIPANATFYQKKGFEGPKGKHTDELMQFNPRQQ